MNKLIYYSETINGYLFTVAKSLNYVKFEFEDKDNQKHLIIINFDTFCMMVYKFLPECITSVYNQYGKNKLFDFYYRSDRENIYLSIDNCSKKIDLHFENKNMFNQFISFMKEACYEIWSEEN